MPSQETVQDRRRLSRGFVLTLAIATLSASTALAQSPQSSDKERPNDDPVVTIFPHSQTARFWVSGQDNVIFQWHPSFRAQYSGPNSLRPEAERAASNVATIFTGFALTRTTEVFADAETADGGGLSDALGLAGFTNVDVVRNPALGPTPYLARAEIRQIIPLSTDSIEAQPGPFSLATRIPVRRLELRFGKFGLADFFDVSDSGSDSHFQFMNWTTDNNGAYDYAADTRGYTLGLIAEYHDRNWAFRFAESLMPKVANGIDLDWNLRRTRAENYELELHPRLAATRTSTIKVLGFVNHANMGIYREAVNNFLSGKTPDPEITNHPPRTTVKYGFGVNLEQELSHRVRAFARWGWNEGQHESYAYTEVDQTAEIGADIAGHRWHRKLDRTGAAFVSNGISADHQHYLELGGRGFLLGDGTLTYGRENIVEAYYNAHLWRGLFAGFDVQHINNPGYNRARGPVLVPGFRCHLEF